MADIVVALRPIGNWAVNYRPSLMRLSTDGVPVTSIWVEDADYNIIGIWEGEQYQSGTPIHLIWSDNYGPFGDIAHLGVIGQGDWMDKLYVTSIEFSPPPTGWQPHAY